MSIVVTISTMGRRDSNGAHIRTYQEHRQVHTNDLYRTILNL